jgi:tetratricopeptide (TPR) repeat protein
MKTREILILLIILEISSCHLINGNPLGSNRTDKCDNLIYEPGKWDEAIQCYDDMLQQDPKDVDAWVGKSGTFTYMGSLFKEKGDILRDGEVAENLNMSPFNETKCNDAIQCYDESSRFYNDSIQYADKATEIDPQNIYALFAKGNVLCKIGKFEETIRCCDKIIKINSQSTDVFWANVWTLRGFALYRLGKYEEAIHSYDNAIKKVERSEEYGASFANEANAYKSKGECLVKLGRNDEANAAFAKYRSLSGIYYIPPHNTTGRVADNME